MASYLTLLEFEDRTVLPVEYVAAIEASRPGWTLVQLEMSSRWVDARLRKRYAVPFQTPTPEIVLQWVTRLVTFECWQRRGYDPADPSMERAEKDADTARAEVLEAANGEVGLFDLPARQDLPSASGVVRSGPRVYSEASPYVGNTVQACDGRDEDSNGQGTTR